MPLRVESTRVRVYPVTPKRSPRESHPLSHRALVRLMFTISRPSSILSLPSSLLASAHHLQFPFHLHPISLPPFLHPDMSTFVTRSPLPHCRAALSPPLFPVRPS